MNISMFKGFDGRINRAKWWLGTIIMAVVGIIIFMIVASIIGASITGMTTPGADFVSLTRRFAVVQLITFIIIVYPLTALWTKRLNDRDRPRYLVYVFWLPTVLSILAGLAGLTTTMTEVAGVATPGQSTIGWIIGLLSLAIGIWGLVEMGFLKGTAGPNPHGPDPLRP